MENNTMGKIAADTYHQVAEFKDKQLEWINEQKQPIIDQLGDLYLQIDELKEELAKWNEKEKEVLQMAFKYEELYNIYVMKDIFN